MPQHWADEAAEKQLERGGEIVISTGISPSGPIHVGNLREVLTADAVYRALVERGARPRFYYVADSFDSLRRVYPFLGEGEYAEQVGRPLSRIPCPCGGHSSYAEHFLEPFLASLPRLGIAAEPLRLHDLYESGRMLPAIQAALEHRERIAVIIDGLTGRRTPEDWSPFTPLCGHCGRMTGTRVLGFDREAETVAYRCACGGEGEVSMRGGGKLVWRVDWPAKWWILRVTFEPFGKDHATQGGSYATGERICREVFGWEPPQPLVYEWIRLSGGGDMSSSRGNVLSVDEMLEVLPPEVLRYLILSRPPRKTISFDPGLPLLNLVDECDGAEPAKGDERARRLAAVGAAPAPSIPFRHMTTVVQIAGERGDEAVLEVLRRSGYPEDDREGILRRAGLARRWLERFAPEGMRFRLQPQMPEAARAIEPPVAAALALLAERLAPGVDAEAVHQLLYEVAAQAGTEPSSLFRAVYLAFLGQERGPRAGWFLASLDADFRSGRLRQAAGR